MFLDANRMENPVKIIAGANARRLHRLHGIEHRARPQRQAGHPQCADEMGDVLMQSCTHGVRLSIPRGSDLGLHFIENGFRLPALHARDIILIFEQHT